MNQSYYIAEDVTHPKQKLIYFEQRCIGSIRPCDTQPGFIVTPSFVAQTGFFRTLEKATIELVCLYWRETRESGAVPVC